MYAVICIIAYYPDVLPVGTITKTYQVFALEELPTWFKTLTVCIIFISLSLFCIWLAFVAVLFVWFCIICIIFNRSYCVLILFHLHLTWGHWRQRTDVSLGNPPPKTLPKVNPGAFSSQRQGWKTPKRTLRQCTASVCSRSALLGDLLV